MINLIEKEALGYIPKASFMQTACLKAAFEGTPLAPDIWVQKVQGRENAIISRYGGRLNITCSNADFTELKEFIRVIGFSEIFCEKDCAEALKLRSFEEFVVLKKAVTKEGEAQGETSLSALYLALKEGEDGDISLPPFENFAPDVSHRLRHSSAVAIINDFGGALAFTCSFGGIVNGISVKKELRGQGKGELLLQNILRYIGGDVFAVTNDKTAEFYIKNGFEICDTAVLVRG